MKSKKDKTKIIEDKLKICKEKLHSNPEQSSKLSMDTYLMAKEINDFEKIALSSSYHGMAKYFLGDLENAYKYVYTGYKIGNYHDVSKESMLEIIRIYATICMEIGETDVALRHFLEGLEIAKEINSNSGASKIYNNLSVLYYNLNDIEKALEYTLKALDTAQGTGEIEYISIVYSNLGEAYRRIGKYDESKRYLEKAYEIAKENNLQFTIPLCLITLGRVYREGKNYEKSLQVHTEALEKAKAINVELHILHSNISLAELYTETNETDLALNKLLEALKISEEIGKKNESLETCIKIGRLYKEKNNIELSSIYYDKATMIDEVLQNEERKEKKIFADVQMSIRKVRKERQELLEINSNLKEISDVCKHITAELDINKIISKSCQSIEKIIGNKDYKILLMDNDNKEMIKRKLKSNRVDFIEHFNTLNQEITNNNETVMLNNLGTQSIDYIKEITGKSNRAKALFSTPLLVEDNKIGAICIFDYFGKAYSQYTQDVLEILSSYISVAINNAQNINKLKNTNEELDHVSKIDPLTRIANRRYFTQHMDSKWSDFMNNNEILSIAMIDIDFFKKYNDTYGHLQGDEALTKVAQTLNDSINREKDFLTRYGGEEFIIASTKRERKEMIEFAEKLRRKIEVLNTGNIRVGEQIGVTVSIGIASEQITAATRLEEITNMADEALYRAKENGRNRVEVY